VGFLGAVAQVDMSLAKHFSVGIIFHANPDNYKLCSSYVRGNGIYSMLKPTVNALKS
jgi:hypothetical protein